MAVGPNRHGPWLRSGQYILFLSTKMISNEKSLNYKVVDLVKSYKFRINFVSIRVHTKNYEL
jgi:hypothetical protein